MSGKGKGGAPKAPPQTELQAQLQQLAVAQGVDQGRRHRGKASLLYSFQEAADIDAETVQRIGIEGLDQLCALDSRFHAYRRTLFAAAMAGGDRDANTADLNQQLDSAISGFCAVLSSYFLLAPAFKALEWLVRKYRVHERNVDALMTAALPYHETEQFVRLVQILRLEPRSCWAFLEPMQHSGAPVPREVLVLRCITDRSLLRFVCDAAQRQGEAQYAGRAFLPFYAVLTCELLDKVPAVDEQLTGMMLPYMLAGVSSSAVADYRAATFMIIGQLASKATFSDHLLSGMAEAMCAAASPAQLGSVVMLLAHLANSQEHFKALPPKAFKQLAKVPGLVDQLAELSSKGCRVGRLLQLLVAVAMDQLPKHTLCEQLLQSMLARVEMGDAARVLAELVLQRAAADEQPGDEAAAAQRTQHLRLLRTLDQRCPEALDAAITAVLPALQQGQEQQQQKGGSGQQEERRQRMLALLSAAFEGTARCVMLEAGTTLLAAAEAPAAGMRVLAVQRLDALAAAAPPGSEAAAAAGTALLRRLHDDSPAVVQAVLDAPSLLRLPPTAVFDGVAACFNRAMQLAADRATKKSERAAARGVMRKALKLLTGPLVESSPALLPRVLPVLLASLLLSPACGPKVVSTAAKAARKLEHPLLAGLRALPLPREGDDDAEQPGAAAAPKSAKKAGKKGERANAKEQQQASEHSKDAADAAHNGRVVAALAEEAASSPAAAASVVQLLSDAARGEVLPGIRTAAPLLLLMAHAAVQRGGPGAAAISLAQVQQLQAQPVAAAVAESLAAGPLPSECFEEGGTPAGPLLAQLAAGTLAVPSLRSTLLLAALRAVPWADVAPRGDKDVLPLLRALCSLRWQPALTALLARVAEAQQDAPRLLSELFAAPPEAEPLDVQQVAAQQAASLLQQRASAVARSKKAAVQQGEAGVALLARCAAALAHPDRHVREAAVQCAQACAKLVQSASGSGLSDAASKMLGAALAEQAAWLAADADAAQQLFEVMLGADDEPRQQLAPYALAPADAQSLGSALLAAAEAEVAAAVGSGGRGGAVVSLCTARQLLAFVVPWAAAEQLLASCQRLLAGAAAVGAPALGSPAAQQQEGLLAETAACFTARRLEQVLQGPQSAATATIVGTWCALMEPSAVAGAAAARLSALRQANQHVFELLPSDLQGRCLKGLLRAASKDPDEACRGAARTALEQLPLQAEVLLPLLAEGAGGTAAAGDVEMTDAGDANDEEQDEVLQQLIADAAAAAAKLGTPRAKQRRGKAGSSKEEQAAAEAAAAVERRREQLAAQRAARQQGRPAAERQQAAATLPAAGGSQECVAALELLQWKDNVQHSLALVPALQAIAEAQLAQLSAAAEAVAGGKEQDAEQSASAAEVIYVLQLCLSALRSLAQAFRQSAASAGAPASAAKPKGKKGKSQQQQAENGAAFDLGLAVRAAQLAPDGAVRNAALALVAELAAGMPQAALDHVLDVVAVVGTSAALQEDEQSERVAAQALQAILPAWTGAGKSLQQLAEAVVAALPRVSPHRRLPLLSGLVAALPEVDGLCSVLALLLDTAVAQQAAAAAGDAQMAEADAAAAAAEEVEPAWAADLAADLMEQAPMLLQASASAALLEHSMEASQQQPWQALPLLSVAFVTQHLEQRAGGASAAAAEELGAAFQRLMQAALLQLQGLGERQAAAQKGTATAPAVLLRTGTAGCYRLLRALQQHMPAPAFLSALVSLAGSSPADRVRRKALQLLSSAVRDAAEGLGWQAEGQTPEAAAAVVDAALSACTPAAALLLAPKGKAVAPGWEPTSPLTKQTALAALGSVAAAFGSQRPDQLLAVLPVVLAAVRDEQAAVRGSALAATAALAAALGPRLVPQLPQAVAAVIAAVEAAAAAVTKAAEADGGPSSSEGGSSSGSESEGEDGAARRTRRSAAAGGVSEAAALELAAALTAVASLVEHLGAFLAPHLPLLLGVLLHPAVLKCSAARCADVAQAIRRQLAQAVPARLLLPPLLAQLEPAAVAGPESAVALLRVLSAAVDAMDAAALASHHEAVFGALLRALDLRRRRPAALLAHSGGVDQCEAAAVQAFVGLTMRLTEARFKPLFFRLLEWAHAVPAADSDLPVGTGQLLRSLSLFSLVNALAEKLRGVFVPYYGLLLDACVAHLSDSAVAAAGKKSKKKKRKSEAAAAEEGPAAPSPADDPLYVEHDWRLRLKVIRALHRCFLYDTGAGGAARFLDEPRFQRLLPPLVAHLGLRPPTALSAMLEADGVADSAAALESSLQLGAGAEGAAEGAAGSAAAAGLDAFGRAVVACLAQLAVTAGSDAQWKPLNHQVLMMTRSLEPRTRLLALETVAQLVGRLSEEYLALLPETLPFLAELLEDAELAVEARAQQLVRALEALSGESLEQYLR